MNKERWNKPNKYEEHNDKIRCTVYNYNMNTKKEMEKDGWTCDGTYYSFFTFWKYKE